MPLLYSASFVRSPVIEPGRGGVYLALFAEMGFALLITTLIGALAGYWADGQLGTSPVLFIGGFLAGAGAGARVMYTLMNRFLSTME